MSKSQMKKRISKIICIISSKKCKICLGKDVKKFLIILCIFQIFLIFHKVWVISKMDKEMKFVFQAYVNQNFFLYTN